MPLDWFKKKNKKGAEAGSQEPKAPASKAASLKGLSIGRLLSEELIVVAPPGLDKEKFIDFLVRRLCEKRKLGGPGPFLAKVMEREQGISTTLDTGLAVPHARVDGLPEIAAILGLVPKGMPDPKQPDLVIRAMFMFFSPNRQEAFTQHLYLLRGVSALFQPAFIEEILRNPSGAEVLKLVQSKESAG